MNAFDADRETTISHALVSLADTLVDEYDTIELLNRLTRFCVELVPAEAAGILLGDARRELRAVAASSEAAHMLELLQLQSDEGPCLDCFETAMPVSVPDLDAERSRWPGFVAAVARQGRYRSVHALPLRLRGAAIGALNLFRAEPGALPVADLALAQALADVATIGILHERAVRRAEVVAEQLQSTLNSRITIEQAKGTVAASTGVGMDAAFDRMRLYARRRGVRLSLIAQAIVERRLDATILPSTPADTGRPRT